jgi:peptidylprolyl isomerase
MTQRIKMKYGDSGLRPTRLDTLRAEVPLNSKLESKSVMKSPLLVLPVVAALAATLSVPAQTAPKPAVRTASAASSAVKLPPGIPPGRGIVRTALSLKYQDIHIGTGPAGQDKQLWKVKYTGWRAADGVKFDSWEEHPQPVMENGKPKLGPDGKPVMGEPQPMEFPHGIGRMIPGFDLGLEGMRVGGRRRIFVPWALAYGYRAIPDHGPDHPGIPAKSDLIFDVELIEVKDLPTQPPMPMPHPVPQPGQSGIGHGPASPGTPGQPAAPSAPSTAPTPQPKPTTPPPGE